MTKPNSPSRRKFLQSSAATGGALMIGVSLPLVSRDAQAAAESVMNAWVRIDSDNKITILVDRSEMGQGVVMALPMLVAEELEVDLNRVKVDFAPPGEMYINAMLGGQITGGSTSVRDAWDKLRIAGAKARVMLVEAAAQKWGVSASDCKAANGVVTCKGKKATYGSLAEAASKLTPPKEVALKDPSKWRYIGKPLHRLDTPGKITGKTEFGIDTKLPGMLYAALAQCPVIGGKATAVDDAKAKAMPGVKNVVKITDGVAVVATSWWQAKQARDALNITWDEGPMKGLDSPGVFKQLADAMSKPGAKIKEQGNVGDAMKTAAKKVEATYQMPFLSHSPMEPMNFTADVKKDSALLIGSIQFQQAALGIASAMTKLKPEQITIKTTFLGGGFGRRIDLDYLMQAVELSMAIGGPVKLVWTREDDMTHDFYRPASLHQMSAALDASGKPIAISHKMSSPSITSRLFPPVVKDGVDPFMAEAIVVPYDIANQSVHTVIHEPGLRVGYLRSVSHALNIFANECFVDEMAAAAGKDPVEFRMSMLAKQPRYANVLKIAAEKSGWGKPLPKGRARGVALMEGYDTYMAQVAEVSVQGGDIKVHKVTVAVDLGRMVNPNIVQQQIESNLVFGLTAALYGDITLKGGQVEQKNFDTYKLVRINEMPKIDMHIVKSTEKPGGIGEPGMALISPAIANAVATLTGKRLRSMPLRLA